MADGAEVVEPIHQVDRVGIESPASGIVINGRRQAVAKRRQFHERKVKPASVKTHQLDSPRSIRIVVEPFPEISDQFARTKLWSAKALERLQPEILVHFSDANGN